MAMARRDNMTMVKYENGRLKARIPYQEEICDLAMAL